MTEKFKKQFYVAGVKFREGWRKNIKELEEDDTLVLTPEPTNKFDKDAVIIGSDRVGMLGYVPAKTGDARKIAHLLREGTNLQATLVELQPDFEPWNALLVEIEEVTNG